MRHRAPLDVRGIVFGGLLYDVINADTASIFCLLRVGRGSVRLTVHLSEVE